MTDALMGCEAGTHWPCPARNAMTVACGCPCHDFDISYALAFDRVTAARLAILCGAA